MTVYHKLSHSRCLQSSLSLSLSLSPPPFLPDSSMLLDIFPIFFLSLSLRDIYWQSLSFIVKFAYVPAPLPPAVFPFLQLPRLLPILTRPSGSPYAILASSPYVILASSPYVILASNVHQNPVQKAENTAVGIYYSDHETLLYPQKLALT
jgi:hypothetical protein